MTSKTQAIAIALVLVGILMSPVMLPYSASAATATKTSISGNVAIASGSTEKENVKTNVVVIISKDRETCSNPNTCDEKFGSIRSYDIFVEQIIPDPASPGQTIFYSCEVNLDESYGTLRLGSKDFQGDIVHDKIVERRSVELVDGTKFSMSGLQSASMSSPSFCFEPDWKLDVKWTGEGKIQTDKFQNHFSAGDTVVNERGTGKTRDAIATISWSFPGIDDGEFHFPANSVTFETGDAWLQDVKNGIVEISKS